jgi:CxxC-x17-CxxC domain-containing protein
MGNFNRDDRPGGGFRRPGRSFGGGRGFDRGGDRGNRPMFTAICSNCGKECQVPFRPTNGKPVYCSDCFEKMGNHGEDSRRPQRTDFRPQASTYDQSRIQLDAISIKLDKILSLLQPKVDMPTATPATQKIEIPVEVKKVFKTSSEIKEPVATSVKKVAKKAAPKKKASK